MQTAGTRLTPPRTRVTPERALFLGAAVILILGSQMPVASHLSPKNGIGYALGSAGGVMLLLQSVYALRKRLPALAFLGSVPMWFQWHTLLGIAAPVLILMHCGFSLGATNSNIALFAMLLVAGSGIVGRYLYARIQRGPEKSPPADSQGSRPLLPALIERLEAEEKSLLQVGTWSGPGIVAAPLVISLRYQSSERLLRRDACAAIRTTAERHRSVAAQQAKFERIAFEHITRRLRTAREAAELHIYERLFSMWHVLHVPLFLILIAAGIVHVVAVHLY